MSLKMSTLGSTQQSAVTLLFLPHIAKIPSHLLLPLVPLYVGPLLTASHSLHLLVNPLQCLTTQEKDGQNMTPLTTIITQSYRWRIMTPKLQLGLSGMTTVVPRILLKEQLDEGSQSGNRPYMYTPTPILTSTIHT